MGRFLLGLALGQSAFAADISTPALEDTFGTATSALDGTGDWEAQYVKASGTVDDWAISSSKRAYARTDNAAGETACGDATASIPTTGWGESNCVSNMMVNTGDSFGEFAYEATLFSKNGKDAMGVVFRFTDVADTYVFYVVNSEGHYADVSGNDAAVAKGSSYAALLKVSGGTATLLDSDTFGYDNKSQPLALEVRVVSGTSTSITVSFDDDADSGTAAQTLTATDTSALSAGHVGLYCYDNGSPSSEVCAFADVTLYQWDEDDDGDPDDTDCDDTDNTLSSTTRWYVDADRDGYGKLGSAAVGSAGCTPPSTTGYAPNAEDCDDTKAAISPGKPELCDSADIDEDCDGDADNDDTDTSGEPVGRVDWSVDLDKDGWGDEDKTKTSSCDAPGAGYGPAEDCDDGDIDINPDAVEQCANLKDDNCNGTVDADASEIMWYQDRDDDGYGAVASGPPLSGCAEPAPIPLVPSWSASNEDCDDANDSINPNALETCDDVDQDCDGTKDEDPEDGYRYYEDLDGDGYGTRFLGTFCDDKQPANSAPNKSGDCDDTKATVYPGATQVPDDGIDQDCDGEDVHEGDTDTDTDADSDVDTDVDTDANWDNNDRAFTADTDDGSPVACDGCATGGAGAAWAWGLVGVVVLRRRRIASSL